MLLRKTVKSPLGSKTKTKTRIATAAIAAAGTTTTIDTITERKMENTTEGLPSCYLGLLQRILPANRDNVVIICDYIQSLKSEINLSFTTEGTSYTCFTNSHSHSQHTTPMTSPSEA